MKNVTKHFKIWLVVTLAIIIAGITLFAVLGQTQTAVEGKSYEVSVEVAVVTDQTAETIKSTTETYLANNGMSVIDYATQYEGDGETLIIKVESINADNVANIKTGLAQAVKTALNNTLDVTVNVYESQGVKTDGYMYVGIAFAVATVIIFIYYAWMEKLSGALSVICTMAISAGLYIALSAICRLPVEPYFGACITFATALAGVLSGGIVNRCREFTRNVGNSKKSLNELADEASWQSLTRFTVVLCAVVVCSLPLIILASMIVKFIAVHVLIATISSLFASFVWTGFFWAIFKKFKNTKKYKATEKAKTEN